MRPVYSYVLIDIETCAVIERRSIPYSGPWQLAKGGNSQQEMDKANQLSQQQLQLMQQQFAMQQKQLGMVNPSLNAIIQNGGMLPQTEAAANTQATQGLARQYQALQGQLGQQLTARGITGGNNAGAGAVASGFGQLGAMEAGQQSDLLNQIQLGKGQQLQSALSLGLGEGGMFGSQATTLGGQGVSALGIGQQAGQAADQASTAFWGSLMGGLSSLGGAAITKCWVAAELYGGWYAPETIVIRAWLDATSWMKPFVWFYTRVGRDWAALIRHDLILRRATQKLFDWFLRLSHA
jgi:hypothetical protein